jgi:TM2 domain-containing membrane protein YozV
MTQELEGRADSTRTPGSDAFLSVLVPGLGQFVQRRPGAGAIQLATVTTYLIGAFAFGGTRALWLALFWNAWSAIDAYWHARREG